MRDPRPLIAVDGIADTLRGESTPIGERDRRASCDRRHAVDRREGLREYTLRASFIGESTPFDRREGSQCIGESTPERDRSPCIIETHPLID